MIEKTIIMEDEKERKPMENMDKLIEYKEMMLLEKEVGNDEQFIKYYNLFKEEYKSVIGKDFEEEMEKEDKKK